MSKEIEETVRNCVGCTLTPRREPPVPMKRSKLPGEVWDMLAIDFNGPYARFNGIMILVIVDCYSRYLTASVVKSTDFASGKKVLDTLFAKFGKPQSV